MARGRVRLESLMAELVRYKAWRHLQDEHGLPFGSLEQFCLTARPCGLGWSLSVIQGLLSERRDPVVAARSPDVKPLPRHGQHPSAAQREREGLALKLNGPRGERSPGASGGRDYWLARIARDHPAVLEALKAGRFASVHEAAIACGLATRYRTVRATPESVAAAALSLLDAAGITRVIAYLECPASLPAAVLEKRRRSEQAWITRRAMPAWPAKAP